MPVVFPATDDAKVYLERWAAERIPHVGAAGFSGPVMPVAVVNNAGRLRAVIVFHDWMPAFRTLQVSGASETPYWAKPGNIKALYHYAFAVAGAHLLWATTPEDLPAWRFDKHIGMTQDGPPLRHRFGPGRHAVICSMTADEWRQSRWHTGDEHGDAVRRDAVRRDAAFAA